MNKQNGGNVIASGGFGCIFKPALKCQTDITRDTNKITKLMTTKNATDEYKQIQHFKSILQVLPNYESYFLLNDFTLCQPDKLTKEDLDNYNKKCKALDKKNITSKNINNSLDQILALNMPYGGIDVEHFIQNYFVPSNLIQLNNSLIQLLVHGISPMNKLNVYHCDIKDSNVLVQFTKKGVNTRLIDWGLSFIHTNKNAIPKKLYRRPFQFNVPFSSILFNKVFMQKYNEFLRIHNRPTYFQIREFIVNYIFIWNDIRGSGHLSAINDIVRKLTINNIVSIRKNKIKEHFIEYNFTYYYIIEYLSTILEKYTENGKLDIITYFNNIFIKNIDIWGFVMIYIVLYEYLYDSFNSLNEYQMQFIDNLKYIIVHFLYEKPIEPIDALSLANELTKLNAIINNFNINEPAKKFKYLNYLTQTNTSIGGKTKHHKNKDKNKNKTNKTKKIWK
jgi:hypothetical protein